MSNQQKGAKIVRRNTSTMEIDRLATGDMLALINQQDKYVADAITTCLPEITRLVDTVCAIAHNGGRIVLAGAGASGDVALQSVRDFAAGEHPLLALSTANHATDFDGGASALQAMRLTRKDMVVALTVSGKTPWVLGVLHQAGIQGMHKAVITRVADSEAAAYVDIRVTPDSGAEVVCGLSEPKARLAQLQVVTMLMTGLAVRSGRVYSNLRVDIPADTLWQAERQIAIIMTATQCTREEVKRALVSCNYHCRTAMIMLLAGVDARRAATLLAENHDHLRLALSEAKPLSAAS